MQTVPSPRGSLLPSPYGPTRSRPPRPLCLTPSSHVCNFVISWMLHKRNHTQWKLRRLAFWRSGIPWRVAVDPTEGHAHCFPFLAVTKKATVYIHIQILEHKFSFLWNKRPRVLLPGHTVNASAVLWGTARLFASVSVPFYLPTSTAGTIPFLCTRPSICCQEHFKISCLIFFVCCSYSDFSSPASLLIESCIFHFGSFGNYLYGFFK